MNTPLSPIVSELETQQAADSHDTWFRAKVAASLRAADNPTTPRYSTDDVARRMAQVIKAANNESGLAAVWLIDCSNPLTTAKAAYTPSLPPHPMR